MHIEAPHSLPEGRMSVFLAAASSFSSLSARSSRAALSRSRARTASCRDRTEAPSLCSSASCEENTRSSGGSKEKQQQPRLCVRVPPRSSGFEPAAPSLQLRHCFYGWTAGGRPSRHQTAPLRCSCCQIHTGDYQHLSM